MREWTRYIGAAAALIGVLALAGCGRSDVASYLVGGSSDVALTVLRDKAYGWSKGWELAVVVRRDPDCQRRHSLKKAADGDFRIDVYPAGGGDLLLHQGERWYVADLNNCQLRQADAAPAEPGEPVGAFEARGGRLTFVAAAAQAAAAVPEQPAVPDQPALPAGGEARP